MYTRGLVYFLLLACFTFSSCALKNIEEKSVPVDKKTISADDKGYRKLDIIDVDGRFFQNNEVGELYIIEGKVVNNYPQNRSYILLKGTIEDYDRFPLAKKLVYAGNIFTDYELANITHDEIEERMKNKSGNHNSNIDIAPHDSVPFMIVFYNLPDTIDEFVVETKSSSPNQ